MTPPLMPPSRQRGLSLIEVLVTVVILALGLLGLAGLHANALKGTQSALNRSLAAQLAFDMADRMRANQAAARNGSYDLAACSAAPTNPATIAQSDLVDWCGRLRTLLPVGDGTVARVANTPDVIITVNWNDQRGNVDGATTNTPFSVRTRAWSN